MPTKIILGADIGWNGGKIVGAKGEVFYPAAITRAKPNTRKVRTKFGKEEKEEFVVGYKGSKYVLGEHAVRQQKLNKTDIGDGAKGSKNTNTALIRALGGIALYLDRFETLEDPEIHVYLGTGAPISQSEDEEQAEQIIERFLNYGKPHEITYNDKPLNIFIQDVALLPEGIISYFSADFEEEDVYLADAGSKTINLSLLVDGEPYEEAIDTLTEGVEFYKKNYGPKEEDVAISIAEVIKASIGDLFWKEGSTIYMGGGFAKQITEAFNQLLDNPYTMKVITPEISNGRKNRKLDAIFANAAGMYFIIKEQVAVAADKG